MYRQITLKVTEQLKAKIGCSKCLLHNKNGLLRAYMFKTSYCRDSYFTAWMIIITAHVIAVVVACMVTILPACIIAITAACMIAVFAACVIAIFVACVIATA